MQEARPGILFAGQGAQRPGMGAGLADASPRARARIEEASAVLGWALDRMLTEGSEEELKRTEVCQPALFVHGIVLLELLRERGAVEEPAAVAGLSLGEWTALTAAGSLAFVPALRLVRLRGQLMEEACAATAGSMASVIGGAREEVEELAGQCGVEVANYNCPGQIVLSGPREGIAAAVERGGADARFRMVKELPVAGAYHSQLMEPARASFAEALRGVEIRRPACPFYANVTGDRLEDPDAIRQGLVDQVVSPVRFEEDLRSLARDQEPPLQLVECGPAQILAGLVRRTDRSWTLRSFGTLADLPAPVA